MQSVLIALHGMLASLILGEVNMAGLLSVARLVLAARLLVASA